MALVARGGSGADVLARVVEVAHLLVADVSQERRFVQERENKRRVIVSKSANN